MYNCIINPRVLRSVVGLVIGTFSFVFFVLFCMIIIPFRAPFRLHSARLLWLCYFRLTLNLKFLIFFFIVAFFFFLFLLFLLFILASLVLMLTIPNRLVQPISCCCLAQRQNSSGQIIIFVYYDSINTRGRQPVGTLNLFQHHQFQTIMSTYNVVCVLDEIGPGNKRPSY